MIFLAGKSAFGALLGLGERKFDPDALATAMSVVGILQGGLLMFAPNLSRITWGIKDKSVYTIAHLEYIGAGILSMGVTCFCTFVMGLEDTNKIVGWTLIVWAVENYLALLRRYASKAGGDPTGQVLWLFLIFQAMHACFVSAAYTHGLLLVAYSLNAFTNVAAIVKPRIWANFNGYGKVTLNNDQLNMLRSLGYENLAMCVFILSLLNGIESRKALGFTSMVITVHCAHALVGKHFNVTYGKFGSLLCFIWMIVHASCAANLVSAEVAYLLAGVIAVVSTLKATSIVPSLFDYPQIAEEELLTKYSWWWKEAHMGI